MTEEILSDSDVRHRDRRLHQHPVPVPGPVPGPGHGGSRLLRDHWEEARGGPGMVV